MLILILTVLAIVAIVGSIYCLIFMRYQTSEPNQWMLVIRKGKNYKSGIGISCYT